MRHRAWWAVLVLALSAGCATETPPATETAPVTGAPPSQVAAGTQGQQFNGTDLAWIQIMIPMTEQMTPLLEIAADRAETPPLRDLAARLRDGHRTEAGELRALLARAGLPDTNPHEGHNMPGMVTPDEVAALSQVQGEAFEKGFTDSLRDYLTQVAMISGSETKVGTDAQTLALATRIAEARTADLTALDAV